MMNLVPDNCPVQKLCCQRDKVRLTISDSIQLLNHDHWNEILKGEDLLLSIPYLRGLERAMENSMEFRYVVFYCEEFKPLGIAYFQVADLVDTGSKYASAVKSLGKGIGSKIVSELKVRTLVNGNIFHTGEHGFKFKDDLPMDDRLELMESTMDRIKRDGDLESKVSIVLFKEYWPEHFEAMELLVKKRYHMFRMDMNMILDLRPQWTSFEDYLEDLTSKARTRIKSILKKSERLSFVDFSAEDIRSHALALDGLFKQVLEGSPFTFGVLEMETYALWKEELGDQLFFQAVYCQDRLVGFQSGFVNGSEFEVQYVGLEYACNLELGVYQRMLIELLKYGIDNKFERIGYGRTAEQAKSTLGAVPVEMRLYTKHRNMIANRLITPVMNSVVPTEFELRNPFKQA